MIDKEIETNLLHLCADRKFTVPYLTVWWTDREGEISTAFPLEERLPDEIAGTDLTWMASGAEFHRGKIESKLN